MSQTALWSFPSDYDELTHLISRLNNDATRILHDLRRKPNAIPIAQLSSHYEDLMERYRQLDTHYGWVLASDREHITKALPASQIREQGYAKGSDVAMSHEDYDALRRMLMETFGMNCE